MNDRWASWKRFFQDEKLKSFHIFPGIYVFAITDLDISDQPFSLLKEIVYVGMSNNANGGLQARLKQFKNTIELKPAQHGGAERFLYDYKEGRKELERTLFISVLYVECDPCSNNAGDLRKMGKVCSLEYEYWAQYVEKFGRLPKYNDKKNAPKS